MTYKDPAIQNWSPMELPKTWADQLSFANPLSLLKLIRHVFGPRMQVELPASLPGRHLIPEYAAREFHRLPNGNFSNRWSAGYATSFDRSMLGLTHRARRDLAQLLIGSKAALDVGCGNGSLGNAFLKAGIPDVWAIDVNPYMLKNGAQRFPQVSFVQAAAERMGFSDERFDACGAFFFFHEIPKASQDEVLKEIRRVLKRGGKLAIVEPSETHRRTKSLVSLIRDHGLRSLYFWAMSHFVYEPFVDDWQNRDVAEWLRSEGFKLVQDQTRVPFREILAEKM